MAAKVLKRQLIKEIEKLPEDRLQEVLDFVEYLQMREAKGVMSNTSENLDPQQDPILKLMGIANVEAFSHNIDKELYGNDEA